MAQLIDASCNYDAKDQIRLEEWNLTSPAVSRLPSPGDIEGVARQRCTIYDHLHVMPARVVRSRCLLSKRNQLRQILTFAGTECELTHPKHLGTRSAVGLNEVHPQVNVERGWVSYGVAEGER
jgi:hypothetical protein